MFASPKKHMKRKIIFLYFISLNKYKKYNKINLKFVYFKII